MRKLFIITATAGCLFVAGCADGENFWDRHVVDNWNDNARPLYAATDNVGPLTTRKTDLGVVLTTPQGMTIYTYKDDPAGQSVCYGRCARAWPPVVAETDAQPTGKLTVVKRKDGVRQWAYDGRPLYTWSKDKSPGETTGHDVGKEWYVARP